MDWFFDLFGFFASGGGVLATMLVIAAAILVWDWRVMLPALFVVQLSLATLAHQVYAVPTAWATAHVTTMLIACLMLGLSMVQVPLSRSLQQAGNWFLRLVAIGAVFACWRLVEVTVSLPQFPSNQIAYFTFVAVAAFIVLSLSDSPVFTIAGLLLWTIMVQIVIEVLLPQPAVIAVIGAVQLLLALTGSYLILADRVPQRFARRVMTDVTFPDEAPVVTVTEFDDSVETPPLPIIVPQLLTTGADATGADTTGADNNGSHTTGEDVPARTPQSR